MDNTSAMQQARHDDPSLSAAMYAHRAHLALEWLEARGDSEDRTTVLADFFENMLRRIADTETDDPFAMSQIAKMALATSEDFVVEVRFAD
jgi:hypothetical protein